MSNGESVLVIFQGLNSYVTPNWYPSKSKDSKIVPTWNYTAVHAKGCIKFIHESEWKVSFLNSLTSIHEKTQNQPWSVTDAPTKFIERQLPAIVGIEINVNDLQGEFKLSQNQSSENRNGVKAGFKSINHEIANLINDK